MPDDANQTGSTTDKATIHLLDQFAREQLSPFRDMIKSGDSHRLATPEIRTLLDDPLIPVRRFAGLCKRRMRALCVHEDSVIFASHDGLVGRLRLNAALLDLRDGETPECVWKYDVVNAVPSTGDESGMDDVTVTCGSADGSDNVESDESKSGGVRARCLCCAIGTRDRQPVVLVGLEDGRLLILSFDTDSPDGELLEVLQPGGNLMSLAPYPKASTYASVFVVCASEPPRVFVYRADGGDNGKARLIQELPPADEEPFEASPRVCFFAEACANKPELFVFLSNGTVRTFDVRDNCVIETTSDLSGADRLVPEDNDLFDAVLMSDRAEFEGANAIEYLVTTQPPEVVKAQRLEMGRWSEDVWSHYDDDRCYVAHPDPGLNRAVLGGRHGDIWCYTKWGIPLAWTQVSRPVRAAVAIETVDETTGVVVAHGNGELTVFWLPWQDDDPLRTEPDKNLENDEDDYADTMDRSELESNKLWPASLTQQVFDRFSNAELQYVIARTPILALLRAASEQGRLQHLLPDRIHGRIEPERFPGFLGVLSVWTEANHREVARLWPVIHDWLGEQQVPPAFERMAQVQSEVIASQIPAGYRTVFVKTFTDLMPTWTGPDEERRIRRATELFNEDTPEARDKALALLEPFERFLAGMSSNRTHPVDCSSGGTTEVPVDVCWELLAHRELPFAVEGIISSRWLSDHVAVLRADGSLYRLAVSPTGMADRMSGQDDGFLLEPVVPYRPITRSGLVGVRQGEFVFAGERQLTKYVFPDSGEGPLKEVPLFEDCGLGVNVGTITAVAVRGDDFLIGTVDGRVLYVSRRGTAEETVEDTGPPAPDESMTGPRVVDVFRNRKLPTPVLAVGFGQFRERGIIEGVACQESSGIHFFGLNGKVDHDQGLTTLDASAFCPNQIQIDDVDGDGLDEVVYLNRSKGHLVVVKAERGQLLEWPATVPKDGPDASLSQPNRPSSLTLSPRPRVQAGHHELLVGWDSGHITSEVPVVSKEGRLTVRSAPVSAEYGWTDRHPDEVSGNDVEQSADTCSTGSRRWTVSALGRIRTADQQLLVTSSGTHVDVWQAVPREVVGNLLKDCRRADAGQEGKEPPRATEFSVPQTKIPVPTFVSRADELANELLGLSERTETADSNSRNKLPILVEALPGGGKSTVMTLTGGTHHGHVIQVASVRLTDRDQDMVHVRRRVAEAIRSAWPYGVDSRTRELAVSRGSGSDLKQFLANVRSWRRAAGTHSEHERLVVVFDRSLPAGPLIEDLLQRNRQLRQEFPTQLKSWAHTYGPDIRFVVLSDGPGSKLKQSLSDAGTEFLDRDVPGTLTDEDGRTVIQAWFPSPYRLSAAATDELLRAGDAHFQILEAACRAVGEEYVRRGGRGTITPAMVRAVRGQIEERRQFWFGRLWTHLPRQLQVSLTIAAHLARLQTDFEPNQFKRLYVLSSRLRSTEQLQQDWDDLVRWSILQRVASRYRFAMRRLPGWVRTLERSVSTLFLKELPGFIDVAHSAGKPVTSVSDQVSKIGLQLHDVARLDDELRHERQLDEALDLMAISRLEWDRLVQISALYSQAAGLVAGVDSTSDVVLSFLKHFLRKTHGLPDKLQSRTGGAIAWTTGFVAVGEAESEIPVGFIAIGAAALGRDRASKLVEHLEAVACQIHTDCHDAWDRSPGAIVMLVCANRDDFNTAGETVQRPSLVNLGEISQLKGQPVLDAELIRRIVFASRPQVALKDVLLGLGVSAEILCPYRFEGRVVDRRLIMKRQQQSGGGDDLKATMVRDFSVFKLIGSRRIGKSTLMHSVKHTIDRTNRRHRAVYLSLDAVKHASRQAAGPAAWQALHDAIANEIRVAMKEGVDIPPLDTTVSTPMSDDVASVETVAASESLESNRRADAPRAVLGPAELQRWHYALQQVGVKFTLLLDEYDAIVHHALDQDGRLTPDLSVGTGSFDAALRAEAEQSDPHLRFVVAGWKELEVHASGGQLPISNIGQTVRLAQLSDDDTRSLILEPMHKSGVQYANDTDSIQEITTRASRHPSFLQCFLKLLFERVVTPDRDENQYLILDSDIDAVRDSEAFRTKVVDTIKENFDGWRLLAVASVIQRYLDSGDRDVPIGVLRDQMAVNLREHGLGNLQVDEHQLNLSKKLMLHATAVVEVVGQPDVLHYQFPGALTDENAESLVITACQQIGVGEYSESRGQPRRHMH